jgi:hypothetical protein
MTANVTTRAQQSLGLFYCSEFTPVYWLHVQSLSLPWAPKLGQELDKTRFKQRRGRGQGCLFLKQNRTIDTLAETAGLLRMEGEVRQDLRVIVVHELR